MQLIRVGAVCVVVLLGLNGCAVQGGADDPSVAKSAAPSGREGPDSEPEPLDPATCLEGTWLVDNEYFLTQYIEIGGSDLTQVTGKVTQVFDADGGVVTTYDGWRIDSVAEGIETSIVRNGTDRGTYIAEGLTLNLLETEVGSKLLVSAAGVEQVHAANAMSFSDVSFTCDATAASIAAPDGKVRLTRIN